MLQSLAPQPDGGRPPPTLPALPAPGPWRACAWLGHRAGGSECAHRRPAARAARPPSPRAMPMGTRGCQAAAAGVLFKHTQRPRPFKNRSTSEPGPLGGHPPSLAPPPHPAPPPYLQVLQGVEALPKHKALHQHVRAPLLADVGLQQLQHIGHVRAGLHGGGAPPGRRRQLALQLLPLAQQALARRRGRGEAKGEAQGGAAGGRHVLGCAEASGVAFGVARLALLLPCSAAAGGLHACRTRTLGRWWCRQQGRHRPRLPARVHAHHARRRCTRCTGACMHTATLASTPSPSCSPHLHDALEYAVHHQQVFVLCRGQLQGGEHSRPVAGCRLAGQLRLQVELHAGEGGREGRGGA